MSKGKKGSKGPKRPKRKKGTQNPGTNSNWGSRKKTREERRGNSGEE